MNTLPVMKSLTMTSREIAELTGKRHRDVLRDIRDMFTQIYDLQDNSCLSYLPIQGVSFDMCPQTKVVKRWRELEEQAAVQANKVAAATTWDQQRQAGKEVRANFTNTLENHGVSGFGFAQCTNGIYKPLSYGC